CRLKPEDLGGYLAIRARAENRTLLVQPALSNHPELNVGANAYLVTARLVTGLSTNGNVIPIFAHVYVFHVGGHDQILARRVALIDVTSGRLTWAPREFADERRWRPWLDDNSHDICVLPDWDTAL